MVSKANQMLGIIKRSFDNMGEFTLNLYKSLVISHLEHGNIIWSPATVNEIMLIEGVQRRATAMINKMHARRCAYFFSVLTKRICMHKTKFLMNIFKYCFKNYIKLHEFANCNSANYDV